MKGMPFGDQREEDGMTAALVDLFTGWETGTGSSLVTLRVTRRRVERVPRRVVAAGVNLFPMSKFRWLGLGLVFLVGLLSLVNHLWFTALGMLFLLIAQAADYARIRRAGRTKDE
jgi:hypothetical protein